ncbi:MAG: hypothetical protein WA981_02085 [Glaciecola sp.]
MVAKEVSLASNNAGVLAVRAGTQAAGFGALAEFLDQLAKKIIHASADINQQAINMSKITTQAVRTNSAKKRYERAYAKAQHAEYVTSLDTSFDEVKTTLNEENQSIVTSTRHLLRSLETLKQELAVGKVLASMSLVEASQAGKEFSAQLADNANNISGSINKIDSHVSLSLKLINKR